MSDYDVAIVGGGCVGISVAYHLARETSLSICIIEKEYHLAQHQSGRNSGVLHPGFNYSPDTLKARFATEGTRRLKDYCEKKSIPIEELGVVVIAKNQRERETLSNLKHQAEENGVDARILEDKKTIQEYEPHASGEYALYSPEAASIDSQKYLYSLAGDAENLGVDFYMGHEVEHIETNKDRKHTLKTSNGEITSSYLVNTAGLHADKLAHQMDIGGEYQVIPFRGEYYELVPHKRDLVKSMVYPTPDPKLPFLGVHFTRRTDDKVIAGPNAVLAFGREAYENTNISFTDTLSTLGYPGFWKLFSSYKMLKVGASEMNKSYRKKAFVKRARRLVPDAESEHFRKSYSGIRAQIVRKDGKIIKDPVIEQGSDSIHVLNAVSPGLTSSLPFGEHVAEIVIDDTDQT
ncbi:MAG: L-2-hydroxyglutarate oxidase [Halobacteria archaeon]|nr:L-2-hydroxyglutarate oxidase [Halobacteria archaeon]